MSDSAQIGKYEIVAPLGSGGFATVYRAVDTTLGRQVALKVLHPQLLIDSVFVQRFYQEARTIATLRHSHIITIYEIGEAGGRLFIAMDLAARSVAERLASAGRLEWDEVLHLLQGTAAALDHAHAQGVVHRDLKPANILLDGADEPLISDFGFARIVSSNGLSTSLSAGTIVGTPGYIAPEVWDENAATPAADIYALGCIVYELLSGRPLFAGATPIQAMRAHDRGPQLEPGWAGEDVPPGIDEVLRRALARDPAARFGSAREFLQALKSLSDPSATRPIPLVGDEPPPAEEGAATETPVVILPAPAPAPDSQPPVMPPKSLPAAQGRLEGDELPPRPTPVNVYPDPGYVDATPAPTPTRRRTGWIIPAFAVGTVALLGAGFLLFGRGGQQVDSGATATAQAELFAAQLATARAEGEQGAVQTVQAQATATAQAELFAAQLATARAEGEQGGAATVQAGGTATAQAIAATAELEAATANAATSVAQADTPTPEPAPTTAPTSAPAATRVVVPAATRAPVATTAPRQPTATTAPTEASSGGAVVDGRSVGTLFTGTARQGDTLANPPGNGTCIQGQVRATGGGRFSSFYVQADKGGDTRPAKHFYDTGNYQLCGLDAGEWGVAVYAVNDQPTGGTEQRAHQVRFRASGRTGEIFYIDFIANIAIDEPTAVPTVAATATPFALYDGEWVGQLTASSAIAPDGRFSFSVRGGRIISLGASGAACFWTHNSGLSVDVSSGNFSFGGTPNQGTNTTSYTVQGSFSSATQASGTLSATDANNNACIIGGNWTATRQ